jgi:hypothetical protein
MKRTAMSVAASIAFAAVTGSAAAADLRYPTSTDEARAAFAERQASAPPPAPPCVSGRTPNSTDEARANAAAQLDASPMVAAPAPAHPVRTPNSTDEARALVASRTSTYHLAGGAPPVCSPQRAARTPPPSHRR